MDDVVLKENEKDSKGDSRGGIKVLVSGVGEGDVFVNRLTVLRLYGTDVKQTINCLICVGSTVLVNGYGMGAIHDFHVSLRNVLI